MRVIEADSFAELYKAATEELLERPEHTTSPRGMRINEIEDMILVLNNPKSNLFKNQHRNIPLRYLAAELVWYFSGRNDVEFISRYSSFWKQLADENGFLNSAYGNLIFTLNDSGEIDNQWNWVRKSLERDRDSRQAIMHFNRPNHQKPNTKDFVCTLAAQFLIRNNKLNMKTIMRSNDIFFGFTFDLPFFSLLQQHLLFYLKTTYPELELGTLVHHAISFHAYERNFYDLYKMMEYEFYKDSTPELDEPLINKFGVMNNNIQSLVQHIENGTSYQPQSTFVEWLYTHIMEQ